MGTTMMTSTAAIRHDVQRLCLERSVRPRVLFVDDDPDLRKLMAQVLTHEGFDTDVASHGQDALDKAHDNPPNVIVLDMMMPVMDGWMFRAHQRYCVGLADVPVVILSGAPRARLANIGAAAILRKPFANDELITVIRALVACPR
jgi:two-component system chemotaxis response regulator CheY